jgi:RHS repeat-associated protein
LRFNGALKSFTYGNGEVHSMTQNARGLPEHSRDSYSGDTVALVDDYYDYDANGNVAAITDGATGRNQRGNRTMAYDALDRLMYADSVMFGNTGSPARVNYSHDALDNLTYVSMPATASAPARVWDYCYDEHWRLTNLKTGGCGGASVHALGYDAQGNVSNKDGTTFDFDYGNRLHSATYNGSTLESYWYDGYGRRVISAAPTGTIQSIYSQGGQLLYQDNGRTGKQTKYFYLSGSLVAEFDHDVASGANSNRYQHTDALGSPVVVTNGPHSVLERNEYEPYGQVLAGGYADRPGFTGHVKDAQTGMNYMQQRYYDPMIGRFLSTDPVTALSNPLGMFNRYDYAADNPYKFTDPDGRKYGQSGPDCIKNPIWCTGSVSYNSIGPIDCQKCEAATPSDGGLGVVPGYPEAGKDSWRSENDVVFTDAADSHNSADDLHPGDPGYIDAKTIKAWAMIESGGSKSAFLTDPLQINVAGDWVPEKNTILGLGKGQEMTPSISATAAIKWWTFKGYMHDANGNRTTWRGDISAFGRYNGNSKLDRSINGSLIPHYEWYAHEITRLRSGM